MSSDTILVFRADANAQMGTGHVMRCLGLAQAWQDQGGTARFVMAEASPAIETRLVTEGMELVRLDVSAGSAADALQTVTLARDARASWAVIDGYQFGSAYQLAMKEAGLRLLFVDDYGHADHYWADLVLNQNIDANASIYPNRESHTRLLLGTEYALLRREFWRWRGTRRRFPPVASRLLVTMGGADPDNVTLTVIQALQETDLDGLEAVVVVGGSNPHAEALGSAARLLQAGRPGSSLRLESNVTDMPGLMAWADMAISAGGCTSWELAFMGLPSLILILAENQRPVAEGLDAAGVAINLGFAARLTAVGAAQAIGVLAAAPEKRAAMARRGQELVDSIGAARTIQCMLESELTLRPAQADDAHMIWQWANDPTTRAASFSSEIISWESHQEWFTASLADATRFFLIAMNAAGTPVGFVRFQTQGQEAVVSINLAPDWRGRGYGPRIIRLAAQELMASTPVRFIHAYVKPDNMISSRAFSQAGFSSHGTSETQGYLVHHFMLRGNAQP